MPTKALNGFSGISIEWAAGFFDGEGYFTCCETARGKRLQMNVVQTRLEPIERFHKSTKGLGYIFEEKRKTVTGKTVYRWCATNDRALQVAKLIYPHLSLPKQEQIDVALEKHGDNPLGYT